MPLRSRTVLLAAIAVTLTPACVSAQEFIATADSLVRVGQLARAESLYYLAARRQPRDPVARIALGRYLASRGALKIGAVLLEEARFFGGNPAEVAGLLIPVYSRIGDFRSLASLPGSTMRYPERARAAWLRVNPPKVTGPDSATVRYQPAQDSSSLGVITLAIGGEMVDATIDPSVLGLVLDPEWTRRKDVRYFKREGDRSATVWAGVTALVRLDQMELVNVPTRFAGQGGSRKARIGLDVLGAFAPTFDPASRRLTLRRKGRVAPGLSGEHFATLTYPSGIWIVRNGVWTLAGARGREAVAGARWTLDTRRGEVIVAR